MRIWIKAIVITTAIAALLLFFYTYWFVDKYKNLSDSNVLITQNNSLSEAQSIKLLKDSLFVSISSKNYANFALQLSSYYAKKVQYDSAARYKELIANRFSNERNWENAGLMYYKAFQHASGKEKEQQMATKAIACFEKIINQDSTEEIKLALANLYFSYSNPKKSSQLLQEVLQTNATNKEALYQLGIRAYQHNNFEKANTYLTLLVKVDSSDINGLYYLAIANFNMSNTNEAKVFFKKLKLLDISEEVEADVDYYLQKIK